MALHEVGYRKWSGAKASISSRWMVIALTGVRLAFRSTWLSRTLVLSWTPALLVGFWFFLYEQSIIRDELRRVISGIVAVATSDADLARRVFSNPAAERHNVWSSLLLAFFRYPQGVMMLIVVGIVAPRLISSDLRNRGYLLYFSRPIQLVGYLFGKLLVVWTFLAMITTVPALALYVVGVFLSPDFGVVWDTWDLPIRVVVASLVLMFPTAAVALACSAFTSESRYAVFSWFAIWIVGWVSYSVLRAGEMAGRGRPAIQERMSQRPGIMRMAESSDWEIISPFHVLGRVQQYVFGLYPADKQIWPYALMLAVVSLASLCFVASRVRKRLRA